MTNNPGIYKIVSPKNKVYIGQSRNVRKRFNMHKHNTRHIKRDSKLYSSLIKYGIENHTFELVHELPHDVSDSILNKYEILYYELYKDCGCKMLNIKYPGDNHTMAQETKNKIRDKNIGKVHKQETVEKLRLLNMGSNNPNWGLKRSEDTIEKQRVAMVGKKLPDEAKNKIAKTILGSKWMYKNDDQLQVKEKDIQQYIDKGWKFGRFYNGRLVIPKNNNTIKRKDMVGKNHPSAKPVSKYDKQGNFIRDYETITEAVKDVGKSSIGNIKLVCLGLRKTAAGFIWKFKN